MGRSWGERQAASLNQTARRGLLVEMMTLQQRLQSVYQFRSEEHFKQMEE